MNWACFFPEGTNVVAIPSWKHPRLFVNAQPWSSRWERSKIFPATLLGARIRRLFLRGRTQISGRVFKTQGPYLLMGSLSKLWGYDVQPVAVLLGTPGPAQKLIVQFADSKRKIVGYLKYGERPASIRRLKIEFEVLKGLPKCIGPQALKLEKIGGGLGLFLFPVDGLPLTSRIIPCSQTLELLCRFGDGAEKVPVSDHPWLRRVLNVHPTAEPWIERLDSRPWIVTPMHGDFAPWNILTVSGSSRCIDWEYGTLQGFPGVDATYHILQTAFLLKRWTPAMASQKAKTFLENSMGFTQREARAVVGLTALMARYEALVDGHLPGEALQAWRNAIFENSIL